MALTQTFFKSFEQVEAHYNSIKPIRGKGDIFGPIVPIGDRRRKHERIIKLSRNCYVLSDGWHMGSPDYYYGEKAYLQDRHMEYYAPVVWKRHKDGRVSVRIMNGTGPSHSAFNSRYSFLSRHLPEGMWLRILNGKQYVCNESHTTTTVEGPKYYLAKGKTIPDFWKHTRDKDGHWSERSPKFTYKKDNAALVFWLNKHVSQSANPDIEFIKWEWDGKSGKPDPKKFTKVNKEAKQAYKQHIKDFFDWGMTMVSMLPLGDHMYEANANSTIHTYMNQQRHRLRVGESVNSKMFKEMLKDEKHELRLPYWILFAAQCYDGWWSDKTFYIQNIDSQETLTKVQRQYNNWINTQAGFVTKGEK